MAEPCGTCKGGGSCWQHLAGTRGCYVMRPCPDCHPPSTREQLAGLRFRVEVACDGYAALMESDVPPGRDLSAYIEGAHDAATGIRAAMEG